MNSVAGICRSRTDAERGAAALHSAGVPRDAINLLSPGATAKQVQSVPTTAAEPPGIGKALGVAVGGTIGVAGGFLLGDRIGHCSAARYRRCSCRGSHSSRDPRCARRSGWRRSWRSRRRCVLRRNPWRRIVCVRGRTAARVAASRPLFTSTGATSPIRSPGISLSGSIPIRSIMPRFFTALTADKGI
jgi:hypothetical protein